MIFKLAKKTLLLSLFLLSFIRLSQEYNTFDIRYQNNIKGDLTFIANQIVNRDEFTVGTRPEDPYNNLNTNDSFWPASNRITETGGRYNYNDYKDMHYIDVDSDPTTFSSTVIMQ
ncbi:internalin, putative [hydrothermal vent metagenome]|uniref:Internalin, putative n=1 Tax=hydrothermal vent metagenome TaxID=652676 RepID=A0A3B0UDR9_9ZZZZ